MGADFIEKATPSFKKSWDKSRVALATADLFTRTPERTRCTIAADIVGSVHLEVGEHLVVEVEAGMLVGRRGTTDVARVSNPSQPTIGAVVASCGIAKGTVEDVHAIAGVVEISLC